MEERKGGGASESGRMESPQGAGEGEGGASHSHALVLEEKARLKDMGNLIKPRRRRWDAA